MLLLCNYKKMFINGLWFMQIFLKSYSRVAVILLITEAARFFAFVDDVSRGQVGKITPRQCEFGSLIHELSKR